MADAAKKDFKVDIAINPFRAFTKKQKRDDKKLPEWLQARPKLLKEIADVPIKQSLKLDPRKWKQKDLDDGVWALANYDLSIFSTVLNTHTKNIDKLVPPKEQRKTFSGNPKDLDKKVAATLKTAEDKLSSAWKKASKSIADKVSLALEEIEADKGDNKKAIAVGKQALKMFDSLDTDDLFANPIKAIDAVAKDLKAGLGGKGDAKAAVASALKEMQSIEGEYDYNQKSVGKVAKMFVALGKKMENEKSSDAELQKFGANLKKGDATKKFEKLGKDISAVGKDLSAIIADLGKGEAAAEAAKTKLEKFSKDHAGKKGTAKDVGKTMRDLSAEFKKIEKKLK